MEMKTSPPKGSAAHRPESPENSTYGVLITGGRSSEDLDVTDHSAEIFFPNSPDSPCLLPELPGPYFGHTQNGGLLCGGYRNQTNDNCRQWNSTEGKFLDEPVHKINPGRYFHVSWTPGSGKETILMDGNTSTILKQGVELGIEGFNLEYRISEACSIPDPDTDTVVITGGKYSEKTTSLYNKTGFIEYLGELNFKRYHHGCTSYVSNGIRVRISGFLKIYAYFIYIYIFNKKNIIGISGDRRP